MEFIEYFFRVDQISSVGLLQASFTPFRKLS